MFYVILSSVFITLFLVLGACSFFGFLELMRAKYPLGWACFQHVIVVAIIAIVFLILAVFFGFQIPDCYGIN